MDFPTDSRLRSVERVGDGGLVGAEDIDIEADGSVVGGLADGWILRLRPDGHTEAVVNTGGRPLGLDRDPQGRLVIADAVKGLLRLEHDGALTVLATEAEGGPFGFTDDVDVGPDGRIWFTDASTRHGYGRIGNCSGG